MQKSQLSHNKYQPLLDDIKQYFASSEIVLHDVRNKLKEVDFNDESLIIKSFKKPNLINNIIYSFFRKTKARRSYEFGLKINNFTPEVVAYIENYQFLMLDKSYFIAKKFTFDYDIRPFLLDKNLNNRVEVFKQFARFTYELHQNNIFHNDFSPGNILIKKVKNDYFFKIVDINRMSFKKLSLKNRAKNFIKLWADDRDLEVILTEYALIAKIDKVEFIKLGLTYNQKYKNFTTRKRNLKKKLKK